FVVDVRVDQDQQVAPLLRLGRETEQLTQNWQIYQKRDSRLGYRDRRHGQAPDHGRLAVADQDLVVRLLGLEREADVHRRRLHARVLGVHLRQDLAVRRDVRRVLEVDAVLLV